MQTLIKTNKKNLDKLQTLAYNVTNGLHFCATRNAWNELPKNQKLFLQNAKVFLEKYFWRVILFIKKRRVGIVMRDKVSPAVVAVVVLVLLGGAALAFFKLTGNPSGEEKPSPTMSADVAKEWNKYTGSAGGPNASGTPNTNMPTGGGGTGRPPISAPGGPAGIPTGPSGR